MKILLGILIGLVVSAGLGVFLLLVIFKSFFRKWG